MREREGGERERERVGGKERSKERGRETGDGEEEREFLHLFSHKSCHFTHD